MTARVLLASNNPHKLIEFRRVLCPLGVEVISLADAGVELSIDESGSTFADNARLKASTASQASGMASVADDSGLIVDALGGEPGMYSARFGGPGLSDADRIHLVLDRMRAVPDDRRTARFVAAVALALPGGEERVFQGEVEGSIARAPAGSNGFGYDPIFYYPAFGMTFGEASAERKDSVSHRARALAGLARYLRRLDMDSILGKPIDRKGEHA